MNRGFLGAETCRGGLLHAVERAFDQRQLDAARGAFGMHRLQILDAAREIERHRRVLAAHREALRSQFPLDGAAIARALRAGQIPTASGIILV